MPFARNQANGAQTDVELVAAPATGLQIVVYHVLASKDTLGTVTFESGTTSRRWEAYLGASSAVVDDGALSEVFRCAGAASLTYTTTGLGNSFVMVRYQILADNGS